jgi:RNA-directed DNA polymerase
MSLQTPDAIRTLQRKLYGKAKAEPDFRFYILYDKVWRADVLRHAYQLASANDGAPGVDGVTFDQIEATGLEGWLTRLDEELMQSLARRIVDPDILRLIKHWLRAPVETTDGDGKRRMEGGKTNRQGVPQGGVISPMIANLYMNRFLKYWRQTGRGEAWQAHVINYADDFVILSRGHAAEALAWTNRTMTRLGLTLNRTKTRLCDARTDRFDFLGYSFGLHRIRQDGRRYIGASPSNQSVQRLKEKVSAILMPGNMGRWEDVRTQLTRLMRGWGGYFSPGSHYVADRAIEAHIYDRVRNFLVRRHKIPTRTGPFTMEAVFGTLGVPRLRHCRRQGVLS